MTVAGTLGLLAVLGLGLYLLLVARGGGIEGGRLPSRPVGPTPHDKYLPVWVIVTMCLSVLVLTWQIAGVVRDSCAQPGRCALPAAPVASAASAVAAAASAVRPGN